MNLSQTKERAWQQLGPYLETHGYELVEVEVGREHRGWVLRLYVDKPDGVTLDDCVAVSQLLNPVLDESDVLERSYVLEVSSPGFARPIRKPTDFRRFTGEAVRLRAMTPVGGRTNFRGVLKGFRDGLIVLECDGATYEVPIENLVKANLDR